jgi:uncharacterized protein (TIGR00369 family)
MEKIKTDRTRREFLERLFNQRAPIARTFGMSLAYDAQGRALIDLPYNPDLDHAGEGVHGGVIMTMLDNAGWFTCALANESGLVVTSELSTRILRPAARTALKARGEMIKAGRRQNVAEMYCWDERENLVAHAVGTFANLEEGSQVFHQGDVKEILPEGRGA